MDATTFHPSYQNITQNFECMSIKSSDHVRRGTSVIKDDDLLNLKNTLIEEKHKIEKKIKSKRMV